MRISLRRLPNGEPAFQRIVLRAERRAGGADSSSRVERETAASEQRSFIFSLLGEKGRAIVAKLNPRFRKPEPRVVSLRGK